MKNKSLFFIFLILFHDSLFNDEYRRGNITLYRHHPLQKSRAAAKPGKTKAHSTPDINTFINHFMTAAEI
ncbi:hypothetical protein M067_3552 [Bacteroides fragilis str. J-143-4]|nr:hypothetical protein M067_3552 [Bacteroides fragilis str. J-143-4]